MQLIVYYVTVGKINNYHKFEFDHRYWHCWTFTILPLGHNCYWLLLISLFKCKVHMNMNIRPISLGPHMDVFSIIGSFSSFLQKLSICFFEWEFLFYAHINQTISKFYTYFCKDRHKQQPLVLFWWSPSTFLNVIRSNVWFSCHVVQYNSGML